MDNSKYLMNRRKRRGPKLDRWGTPEDDEVYKWVEELLNTREFNLLKIMKWSIIE